MKPQAIIFDIDGTLTDCQHRRHWVEGKQKNWDLFFREVGNDSPKWNCINFLVAQSKQSEVLYVSGRPERCRQDTISWFERICLFSPNKLFMRPDGDYTPDDELKKQIYLRDIEPHYNVTLVLDDRTRVVNMWRSLALECWQVADGDF